MNFFDFFYAISFIFLFFRKSHSSNNLDLRIVSTGVETISPCSIGLQFFVDVNNASEDLDYTVELIPDQCYLELGQTTDYEIMEMIGECVDMVPRGTTKRLVLVAPVLDQFERHGYCIAYLDSKSRYMKRNVMRDHVKIPFDTRIKNKAQPMILLNDIKSCTKIDEDPLNSCKAVDCDVFYNGRKSFYNKRLKRCVKIPACIAETQADTPNIVYDAVKNRCINEVLTNDDVDYIKNLLHSKKQHRETKDVVIIKKYKKKPVANEDKSSNSNPQKTLVANKEKCEKKHQNSKTVQVHEKQYFKYMVTKYLAANRLTLIDLGVVITVQCGLMCTMIYCLTKKFMCCSKKKVVRKFFNYRQDASVTTPLIGTSTRETDTTEYQYMSESTDLDQKLKCYKACQKDPKVSLSDDILSKCLNRRDWNTKTAKSEGLTTIPIFKEDKQVDTKEIKDSSKLCHYETRYVVNAKKPSETKINFESEKSVKCNKDKMPSKAVKSIIKKIENQCSKFKKRERKELKDSDIVLSEKELQCHSYINMDDVPTVSSDKLNSRKSDNVIVIKKNSQRQKEPSKSEKSKYDQPLSTGKGAQACFSNDSIDDFLSERGVLFLAGENISKYSFSTDSDRLKSSVISEVSSKTSKNNVVKNMLSLITGKAKQGPVSDPGAKKSKDSIDLELIHMSRASVYSSSINDSECLKNFRKVKDSRSSL